ncbi:MAG: TPM domain-containing protein [Rothia sp. (in: high G+C Gram-positive bacteria)]|nr:TPM domain-containing protein [Rothia sp. (in: high G+C Gram-positive bacteria)]
MKKGGWASSMHPFTLLILIFALFASGFSSAAAFSDKQYLSEGGGEEAAIPEYPAKGHVVDSADALTSAEEESINQQIESLRSQSQNNLNIDVYLYRNSSIDSQLYTNQIAENWYGNNAHQGDHTTLIAVNLGLDEGYIDAAPKANIPDEQKVDIMVNRMGPYYLRDENFKGTQVGIDELYKATMKAEADRQAAAMQERLKRIWLVLLILGVVLVYLGIVRYLIIRRRRERYRFADAQIYDALSANPGLEVSDEMRNAYRSYRAYYHHDPAGGTDCL